MALSVRTRFEVFKRDGFTCRYCGRKSPDVVLEVDHIVPVSKGGSDDEMNLATACWECNHGKAGVPLNTVITGEDPHDQAVLACERQRQLDEYNRVIAADREARDRDAWDLIIYWQKEQGVQPDQDKNYTELKVNIGWLMNALTWCPKEQIREFMDYALYRGMTKNWRYVKACARNWRYEKTAEKDVQEFDPE